ncbi:MAG: glutathione S-transferase [Roseovarius sp.]
MSDFTLYYWPLPFRGQFVRALLAHAGARWDEPGPEAVAALKDRAVGDQPVPLMAPPVLIDHAAGVSLAQMPAILAWLGTRFALLPRAPGPAALTHKIVADANDVLDEMTRFGGRSMWTRPEWDSFAAHRLRRWMAIFEETGRRHGLTPHGGHILGGDAPGLADLVSATLWFTMTDKLAPLAGLLAAEAPAIAAHGARIMNLPPLAALRAQTDARFGALWCGGQIEASIREMLG